MAEQRPSPSPREIIRQRRGKLLVAQGFRTLAGKCLLLALALWLLLTKVFLITQVGGNGMYPAMEDGDLVLAYRLQDSYAKNDVVLYWWEGKIRVGRILGREGDVIMMDDSGNLLLNGTTQGGEILYPTYAKEGVEYPFVVPQNAFYLLGDYRTQCTDSRDYGAIPASNVQGKVITLLRRRGI